MTEKMRQEPRAATPDAAPASPPPAPIQLTLLPAVVGIVVIGIAALVVGFWVDSKRGAEGVAGSAALPQITLVEPAPGADVASPIPVVFEVPARLRWVAGGWQVGRLHIHAGVNGTELMPGSRDIEPLGQNRYRWTLPALPAGEHTLRLFWSGPDHRPIEEGASESVTVRAR